MSDNLNQKFSDFLISYGSNRLNEFFDKNLPPDAETFVKRLYSDIHIAIAELEELAHELQGDGETKLRSFLRTFLRGRGYKVTAEADHRGHTDLLVKSEHLGLTWIGETKKYDSGGYVTLSKGLKQLHSRYMKGRDRDCGLIVFVFRKNAARVVQRWKSKIEDEELCNLLETPRDDSNFPLSFWTDHRHEGAGLRIRVKHIFATLFHQPEDSVPESQLR